MSRYQFSIRLVAYPTSRFVLGGRMHCRMVSVYAKTLCTGRSMSERKPPALQPLYDSAPVSFGVEGFDGYTELISRGTLLPTSKTQRMESALDYVRNVSFGICYSRNPLNPPIRICDDIAIAIVNPARAGLTQIKVVMEIGKDLKGSVTIKEATETSTTVSFDGNVALQSPPSQ